MTLELNLAEATELVSQLQTAHRLAAGYYQGLFSLLSRVSQELELEFWDWAPCYNKLPCRSTTLPGSRWAWDMLPMYATEQVYGTEMGETAKIGNYVAVFRIQLEDSYTPSRQSPDPLTMPEGNATVQITLYCCEGNAEQSFDDLWNTAVEPSDAGDTWEKVGESLNAKTQTWTLAAFIAAPDSVVSDIRKILKTAPKVE